MEPGARAEVHLLADSGPGALLPVSAVRLPKRTVDRGMLA